MAKRTTALLAILLLAGVLQGLGCAGQVEGSRLTDDVYAADGVDLPPGSSPETIIRAILEKSERRGSAGAITVAYPREGSVFPPEIVAPTFLWHDSADSSGLWLVDIAFDDAEQHIYVLTAGTRTKREIDLRCVTENNAYRETDYQASAKAWKPSAGHWATTKSMSVERDATVTMLGLAGSALPAGSAEIVSRGSVRIRTSRDPVGATIFYRDVPLMPTRTLEGVIQPLQKSMFPLIQWRLRDISRPSAPVVMEHLPNCANCHTFSADGGTLAMDMDSPAGDKGAYVVKDVSPTMMIEQKDVFTWNDFAGRPPETTTFGLFSQISPDGKYVVSMVNEEIFVANYGDYRFLQTFYPTRGILAVYERETGEIRSLPGAADPDYVQGNPAWSPDGKTIVFLRAKARPAYGDGPRPTYANDPLETPMLYDLYRIPFNGGEGGVAEPIPGASNNGMSHSFPRFSPDGKWIVFVKAKNGMLLRPDGKLNIIPAEGGEARLMNCNTDRMNSYHSWSPNGRWLVFSSKQNTPFTQMFLTHVDEDGNDTPPILVPDSTAANRAVNLPEFVDIAQADLVEITTPAVEYRRRLETARELKEQGRIEEAIDELEKSLELKSDYWDTHLTLADILVREGRPAESVEHYRAALELNPRYFYTLSNLGVALNRTGQYREAIEHFTVALEINPSNAMTRYSLGKALVQTGRSNEATAHFAAAVEIDPGHYAAHQQLGLLLTQQRRTPEAIEHYRRAIEINADYYPAYDSLARVLAAHPAPGIRDGAEAVRLAETACSKTGFGNESYLHTLAVAYAEMGRFEDAVRAAERALDLAQRNDRQRLAAEIETHLALFRNEEPLRIGS